MEVASDAAPAINFPAVMAIVAQIVADPRRFGVKDAREAGPEETAPIEHTLGKIKSLQGKIQEVEVQAAIRQVQVKILEIKIRQVELMVLVRQAQQVVELKGKEASLMIKKRQLEQRIIDLDQRIRAIDATQQVDPSFALNLLSDLQQLLGQTETALAAMNAAADEIEDVPEPNLAIEPAPDTSEEHL